MRFLLAAREWTMRRPQQLDGVVNILHLNIFQYRGDIYIPRASNAEFYFVVVNTMFYWVKHRTYGMLCFTLIDVTSFLHSHKYRCRLKPCKHYEAGPEKEPGAQTS